MDYPQYDEKTAQLLQRGDVLGVTQAESPAMRTLCSALHSTNREDCTFKSCYNHRHDGRRLSGQIGKR